MINISKKEMCCGCSACHDCCPVDCIEMKYDKEGFRYPEVDKSKCINCKKCESVCPIIKSDNSNNNNNNINLALAVQNENESERLNSSSGGIFPLLARQVINNNGLVAGAMMNEDLSVKHILVDNEKDLTKLYGSKYLQSNLDSILNNIKSELEKGKLILFSGTPCQIAAIKSFLNRDYDNLILVDVICHGVPSKNVWDKYIDWKNKQNGKHIKEVDFRNKKNGWKRYNIALKYDDLKIEYISHSNDLFLGTYLDNIDLRPSCYKCNFKGYDRISDITLGDLWGINKIIPEFDDDKGTSLVLINSKKGFELWNGINSKKYSCIEINKDLALKYNSALLYPVEKHLNQKKFYRDLDKKQFDKVVDDAMRLNVFQKLYLKVKRKINKKH